MKALFTLLILATVVVGFGKTPDMHEGSRVTGADEDDPKATGYIDGNGWKQGYFILYGRDFPEKKEYPADGRVEEGAYKDNRKIGEWIIYHFDGKTPRLKGTYVDGRPNGPFTKYYESGVIKEKATQGNGKVVGDYVLYHPNGKIAQQKTLNTEGKTDGPVIFYYESGQPQFEFTSVNGVTTGQATRYWEDGSVKEILVYDASGTLLSTTVVNATPPVEASVVKGSGGPSGTLGEMRDGKKFEADGYNKVYNKAEDLWLDGLFKSGKLWDGKLYKYDSEGILLKIEIWKNGAYHSDGQL